MGDTTRGLQKRFGIVFYPFCHPVSVTFNWNPKLKIHTNSKIAFNGPSTIDTNECLGITIPQSEAGLQLDKFDTLAILGLGTRKDLCFALTAKVFQCLPQNGRW